MTVGPISQDAAGPTVQHDVILIVSGNFTPDALGPDVYYAVLVRLAARPQAYLAAFRAFVPQWADAGTLGTLHLPSFLNLIARTDPAAARAAAAELLVAYERATKDDEPESAASAGGGTRTTHPAGPGD